MLYNRIYPLLLLCTWLTTSTIVGKAVPDEAMNIGVSIGDISGFPGDTVCVPITVSNFENVCSYTLYFDFDTTQLRFISAHPLFLGEDEFIANQVTFGDISFLQFVSNPLSNPVPPGLSLADNDTLLCLNMLILPNAMGSTSIDFFSAPGIAIPEIAQYQGVNCLGNSPFDTDFTPGSISVLSCSNDPFPQLTVSSDTITCGQPTTALMVSNADPGTDLAWTGPMGYAANGDSVTTSVPGDYRLMVQNGACRDTFELTVESDSLVPEISSIMGTDLNCTQLSSTLNVTSSDPAVDFTWTNADGDTLATVAQTNVSVIGTYTATVRAMDNGCSSSASVTISDISEIPDLDLLPPPAIDCGGQSVSISTNIPGFDNDSLTINWTTLSGGPVGNTPMIMVSTPGQYIAELTNNRNNCVFRDTATVATDTISPSITQLTLPDTITCTDATVDLTSVFSPPTAGHTDGWTIGGNNLSDPSAVSEGGTYVYRQFNPTNNCSTSLSIQVTVDTLVPTIDTITASDFICNTPSGLVNVVTSGGPYQYQWVDLSGTEVAQTQSFLPPAAGPYSVDVTDPSNGCLNEASIVVNSTTNPVSGTLTSSGSLSCRQNEDTLQFTPLGIDVSDLLYRWQTPLGDPLGTTNQVITDQEGLHQLIIENTLDGCRDTLSIMVNGDFRSPDFTVTQPTPIDCEITSSELVANIPGFDDDSLRIEWRNMGGTVLSTMPNLVVTEGNNYVAVVRNTVNGCGARDTVEVQNNLDTPNAEIGLLMPFDCNLQVAEVNVANPVTDVSYEWSFVGNEGTVRPDGLSALVEGAGQVILRARNSTNGCSDESQLTFSEGTGLTLGAVNINSTACDPTSTYFLIINEVSGGSGNYTLNIDGFDFSLGDIVPLSGPGNYLLQVEDDGGCSLTETIEVTPTVVPEVEIQLNNPNPSFGDSVVATAVINDGTAVTINWLIDRLLVCEDCSSFSFQATNTLNLSVEVITDDGCRAQDNTVIFISKREDIFLPNVFSPNFDGVNDRYQIFPGDNIANIEQMSVYDRWGNQVFLADNAAAVSLGWDGSFRGEPMPQGSYLMFAQVTYADGRQETVSQSVQLLR
ncbi:MAG: gliding motility-associated C-terminal domain-containing protein [Bacteroidota bacterium]